MATGRGQAMASFMLGVEKVPRARREQPRARQRYGGPRPVKPSCTKAPLCNRPDHRSVNYLERIPHEVLMKIILYLDAGSLFCISHVNKAFYELANSNDVWYRMYSSKFEKRGWKPKQIEDVGGRMKSASIQEKPKGFWRDLYFRKISGYNEDCWKRQLKRTNPYTGLSWATEQVLRSLCVTWVITVTDKRGRETSFEQSRASFSESSVTVWWTEGSFPFVGDIDRIQLHSVRRVPLDCPALNKPGWRCLISQLDGDTVRKCERVVGSDSLMRLLHVQPGLVMGVWRGQRSVAFFMVNLHFYRLVERCLLGTHASPYTAPDDRLAFDDVDPEYGLHGYSLHISLHDTLKKIMSECFSQLFCRKDEIHDGFIKLMVISRGNLSQQTPLSGKFILPWKSGYLSGNIKECCMMSLTVFDETHSPFWCFCVPVTLTLSDEVFASYDLDGDNFYIEHRDANGRVRLDLVWLREQAQFFLVNFVVYVATSKVNKHFGRAY